MIRKIFRERFMKLYEEVRSWCEANKKDPEDYGLSPEDWEKFVEERRQRFFELRSDMNSYGERYW